MHDFLQFFFRFSTHYNMSTHDRATADDASQKRTGSAIGDKATYGFITLGDPTYTNVVVVY